MSTQEPPCCGSCDSQPTLPVESSNDMQSTLASLDCNTMANNAGERSDTAAIVSVERPCHQGKDGDVCYPVPQDHHDKDLSKDFDQSCSASCCEIEGNPEPETVGEFCSTGCCGSKDSPGNNLISQPNSLCKDACCKNEDKPNPQMVKGNLLAGCCGSTDSPGNEPYKHNKQFSDVDDKSSPQLAEEACSTGCCGSKNMSVGQAFSRKFKAKTEDCCEKRAQEGDCCEKPEWVEDGCEKREQIGDCCEKKERAGDRYEKKERVGDCCETNSPHPGEGACPCCVTDIVRCVTSTYQATNVVEVALNNLELYAENLRRCCAILENCCRRACCLLQAPQSVIPTQTPQFIRACEVEELNTDVSTQDDAKVARSGSTLLQLEVGGMDCPDCVPKVTLALGRLPSVTAAEIDYFSGIAQLRFDPEVISPPTIITYVSRATGFRIKEVTKKEAEMSHLHLSVRFDGHPPAAIMEKYDVLRGSSKDIWNVFFRVAGKQALRPRDVLAELTDYGGRLAFEPTEQDSDTATRDLRILMVRTALCLICTIPILILAWARLRPSPILYGGLSVGLSTIVQLLAFPMYSSTSRSILFLHQVDMNVLAAVSTLASYIFSLVAYACDVAGKPFSTPFFETSTLLVTLIYLGRTVQGISRQSAGSAVRALHKLQSKEVRLVEGGMSRIIDARILHYGDVIEIVPDTLIVTDGVVLSGSSDVDESSLTGESATVFKLRGSRVIAGTINLNGTLRVEVTRLLHENSLSRMTQLVRHVQSSRVPLQDYADRLSAIVLPLAVTAAGLAFLIWGLIDVYVKKKTKSEAVIDGLMKAIAVLVVSCPCAMGLAIPIVMAVSIRILARSGILVRSADILHVAQRVSVVVFDKTGTLSQGLFTVMQSEVFVEGAEHQVYQLVKGNNHPVAQGVYRFLQDKVSTNREKEIPELPDRTMLPGKGVRAILHGYELLGGNATFTGAASHPTVVQYLASGHSLFVVTLGGVCLAVYGLADLPRTEAPYLVETLNMMGKKVVILSGDNEAAVSRFAAKIGIDKENAHASCTPEDKQAFIMSLQSAQCEVVFFIGDGTNDGPALATADASLAVVSGSEVAHTSAGAILLQPDIKQGILQLLSVAHSAEWRSRVSLTWCAVYMVGALILTSGLAVNFSIEPRWAGLGEVASVLPVVLIGLSMDWKPFSKAGGIGRGTARIPQEKL